MEPCAVCTWHMETMSVSFLVEPQNQGRRFVSGLALKPLGRFCRFDLKTGGDGFSRFGLKTGRWVSWLSLKTKVVEGFLVWTSKPAVLVWLFEPQNHRDSFLIWASKPSSIRFVGCATKPMEEGRRGTCVEI
jgi:hypothetical protein